MNIFDPSVDKAKPRSALLIALTLVAVLKYVEEISKWLLPEKTNSPELWVKVPLFTNSPSMVRVLAGAVNVPPEATNKSVVVAAAEAE